MEAVARALEPPAPVEVVRELAVVDDGDIREGVGPVGVGARDVDVGLGRHAHVPDRMGAVEAVEGVLPADGLRVSQVLDDLERMPEGQHLGVGHVLDEVGEQLEVAVVVERDPVGVVRLLRMEWICAPRSFSRDSTPRRWRRSRSPNSKSRGVFASASL